MTVGELRESAAGAESTVRRISHVGDAAAGDAAAIRAAFGAFPAGVAALCARVDGRMVGMVASSFSVGVSFEPPIVMFSAQSSSETWPVLRRAESIGISVLGSAHAQTTLQLASRSRDDRFVGVDVVETDSGALLIEGSTLWIEARVMSETPAGDHLVVLLEVAHLGVLHEIEPLIYRSQRFHGLRAAG